MEILLVVLALFLLAAILSAIFGTGNRNNPPRRGGNHGFQHGPFVAGSHLSSSDDSWQNHHQQHGQENWNGGGDPSMAPEVLQHDSRSHGHSHSHDHGHSSHDHSSSSSSDYSWGGCDSSYSDSGSSSGGGDSGGGGGGGGGE